MLRAARPSSDEIVRGASYDRLRPNSLIFVSFHHPFRQARNSTDRQVTACRAKLMTRFSMANFTGTASDEIITPDFVSPTVTATGGARPSNAADTINAGSGNDVIESGGGNDLVIGGPGNDTAILGAGNDTFVWNPGDGSDTVEGGSGTDTLLFNGSNVSETMTLSANGSRTRLFRDVGNVTMDVNSMEDIDINALGGADNITIDDLTGTGVKRVAIDLSAPIGSGSGDGAAD